jgi:hypothetical protein
MEIDLKTKMSHLKLFNISRFKLEVPVKFLDCKIPKKSPTREKCMELMKKRCHQNLDNVTHKLEYARFRQEQEHIIRDEIKSNISHYLKNISLFQSKESCKELYRELSRMWDNDIKVEALYSLLEDYSMLAKISFNEFKHISDNIHKRLYPHEETKTARIPTLSQFDDEVKLVQPTLKGGARPAKPPAQAAEEAKAKQGADVKASPTKPAATPAAATVAPAAKPAATTATATTTPAAKPATTTPAATTTQAAKTATTTPAAATATPAAAKPGL